MATPAIIVVVTVALATLGALALVILGLVRRLKELTRRISAIQETLEPQLELLARETEIAGHHLERLADSGEVRSQTGAGALHSRDRDGGRPASAAREDQSQGDR